MDRFCEIGSTNPSLNMYEREAIPLTVANHTSTTYSSPLHSPTSSVPSAPLMPHPPSNHIYNHHSNSGSSAHSTTPSSASGLHPQGQQNEQMSPTSMSGPSQPPHGESSSPTEGMGILDTVDDSVIAPGKQSGNWLPRDRTISASWGSCGFTGLFSMGALACSAWLALL